MRNPDHAQCARKQLPSRCWFCQFLALYCGMDKGWGGGVFCLSSDKRLVSCSVQTQALAKICACPMGPGTFSFGQFDKKNGILFCPCICHQALPPSPVRRPLLCHYYVMECAGKQGRETGTRRPGLTRRVSVQRRSLGVTASHAIRAHLKLIL
jgi:hypothetical protein